MIVSRRWLKYCNRVLSDTNRPELRIADCETALGTNSNSQYVCSIAVGHVRAYGHSIEYRARCGSCSHVFSLLLHEGMGLAELCLIVVPGPGS